MLSIKRSSHGTNRTLTTPHSFSSIPCQADQVLQDNNRQAVNIKASIQALLQPDQSIEQYTDAASTLMSLLPLCKYMCITSSQYCAGVPLSQGSKLMLVYMVAPDNQNVAGALSLW